MSVYLLPRLFQTFGMACQQFYRRPSKNFLLMSLIFLAFRPPLDCGWMICLVGRCDRSLVF